MRTPSASSTRRAVSPPVSASGGSDDPGDEPRERGGHQSGLLGPHGSVPGGSQHDRPRLQRRRDGAGCFGVVGEQHRDRHRALGDPGGDQRPHLRVGGRLRGAHHDERVDVGGGVAVGARSAQQGAAEGGGEAAGAREGHPRWCGGHDGVQVGVGLRVANGDLRRVEDEYLEFARATGLSTMVYNPLGGGLLTGRHTFTEDTTTGRFGDSRFAAMYRERYWNADLFAAVERLTAIAAGAGIPLTELALRWLAGSPRRARAAARRLEGRTPAPERRGRGPGSAAR
ncbi:aldo/keto reductase [Actinokineospora spheciospongiae]|uniref:aldo/keto reductase n=1 Tax=Actinokineospora spheciospongiae TaxID=909613 RepID=UPI001F24E756|nr:aldo/keto reductase [Actinokineospora spheciospongiae]